jgi:hypothetical protein
VNDSSSFEIQPSHRALPIPEPTLAAPQTQQQESDEQVISQPAHEKHTGFENGNRFLIRASYLDAHYDELDSRLENGATSIGVAAGRDFGSIEARVALDFFNGMDQEVTLRNTRTLLLRGELLKFFNSGHMVHPFVGASLGLADVDVNSEVAVSSNEILSRENAKGTGLEVGPAAGLRFDLGRSGLSLDLSAEWIFISGPDQIDRAGGANLSTALTFP